MKRQLHLIFLCRWWQSFHQGCLVLHLSKLEQLIVCDLVQLFFLFWPFWSIPFALREWGSRGKKFSHGSYLWVGHPQLDVWTFQGFVSHVRPVIKFTKCSSHESHNVTIRLWNTVLASEYLNKDITSGQGRLPWVKESSCIPQSHWDVRSLWEYKIEIWNIERNYLALLSAFVLDLPGFFLWALKYLGCVNNCFFKTVLGLWIALSCIFCTILKWIGGS